MPFQMQETKTMNAYFMIQMKTLQVWQKKNQPLFFHPNAS
jgi:hypothetical protein